MRVSTGMIFDGGTQNILGNQSVLFKTQNQLSTGRRILTPADDPVASAQVLLTTQSQSVNKQFMENQANARDQLKLVEGNLDGLTNLLQEVRERSVQLGNASLTDKERAFIQSEFRSRFEDLVAIGNQQNGAGQYMFSGFQGSVKPFGINPAGVAPGSSSGIPSYNANNPIVSYFGDQGERLLQVEASRHLGTTVSGEDTFMRIKNGNGEFFVTTPTSPLPPALPVTPNAGTAIADQGSVLDVSKWNATPAVMQPQNFEIRFQIDQSVVPAKTYYHLFDVTSNASMMPGAPSDPGTWAAVAINPLDPMGPLVPQNPAPGTNGWLEYTPGMAIPLNGLDLTAAAGVALPTDLGIQVIVTGAPAHGDKFVIQTAKNQSIFDTFQNLIDLAGQPVAFGTSGNTELMNDLSSQMAALDRGLENVLRVRASVGARLNEIDSLGSVGSDLDLQFTERISNLQDLDYAKAITDLQRQEMQLQAAQQSFSRISSLSLFDVLR